MKNYLFLVLFLVLSLHNYAQDLIVRSTNDSVSCRIDSIGTEKIYLTIDRRVELIRTTVSKESIITYDYGYYTRIKEKEDATRAAIRALKLYPKFRIAINGGVGYQIQKINEKLPEKYKEHLDKLKYGYVFGGEFQWFFKKWMGVGVNYQQFGTSTPVDEFGVFQKTNYPGIVILSESIVTHFIGLGFTNRIFCKEQRHSFLLGYSLGYFAYNNKMTNHYGEYDYKDETMGFSLNLGYDIRFAKNFYLGFKISSLFAYIDRVEPLSFYYSYTNFIGGDSDQKLNLSRVDFTIVVSFSK